MFQASLPLKLPPGSERPQPRSQIPSPLCAPGILIPLPTSLDFQPDMICHQDQKRGRLELGGEEI